MESFANFARLAVLLGALTLTSPARADLLTHVTFDGALGDSILDAGGSTVTGIGTTGTYTANTSAGNSSYVGGLNGTLPGTGNALQVGVGGSFRTRIIIDRATPEWVASGLVGGDTLIGQDNTTLFGSFLVKNDSPAAGFAGLEFAAGDPNANRVLTLGEAGTGGDFAVVGPGQAGAGSLALPPIVAGATREIAFRIDYGVAGNDTFTLLNSDLTDGASATGPLQFSTLHLASFGGSPAITYDEIRLGTTVGDVVSAVPEPSSFAMISFAVAGLCFRRRRSA